MVPYRTRCDGTVVQQYRVVIGLLNCFKLYETRSLSAAAMTYFDCMSVDQRVISRKRNKEELQIEKAESKDGEIRPPYPKYSKMSSDRCERDREAEEMWQHRERWQSRVRDGARMKE